MAGVASGPVAHRPAG